MTKQKFSNRKQKRSGKDAAGKNPVFSYYARIICLLLAAGVFTGCAQGYHTSDDEILILSAGKYERIEGYRARFSRMADIGGVKTEVEGEIAYKSPDNMKMNTTDIKGGRGIFWQVVVWDGENIWKENRGSSRRVRGVSNYKIPQVKPLLESDFLGLKKLDFSPNFHFSAGQLENLLEYYSFSVLGKEDLRGEEVNIVAGNLKRRSLIQRFREGFAFFPGKIKFYIGAEDGFHYKKEYFDRDGKLVFSEEFEDVVFDSEISEDIFAYRVPEEAEVEIVDLSETEEICRICPVDESLPQAADFTLPDIEGNMHSLSDFHGRFIVLLITEPTACFLENYAAAQYIHETFKDKGVKVIVVFRNRDIGSIKHLIYFNEFDFLTLYTPEGYPTSLKEDYEIRYVKTIYYIDQEGNIRRSYAGPMPASRLRREVLETGTQSGFFERNIRAEIPPLSEEIELLSAAEMDMWFRHFEKAEKKLDKLLEINPENLYALDMKGGIASGEKRFEEAIEIFEDMSRIAPEWDYPHNRIAHVCQYHFWRERRPFRGKNVLDYAIDERLKALGINPESLHTHYQLGQACWQRSRHDEAIEALTWPAKKGLSLSSSSTSMLGYIYHRRGDLEKAAKYYGKSVALNRLERWTWVQLAEVFEEKGNIEEAIKCYREIINIDPNAVDGHIAKAREGLKRHEGKE